MGDIKCKNCGAALEQKKIDYSVNSLSFYERVEDEEREMLDNPDYDIELQLHLNLIQSHTMGSS
jgi:hypothetical protein